MRKFFWIHTPIFYAVYQVAYCLCSYACWVIRVKTGKHKYVVDVLLPDDDESFEFFKGKIYYQQLMKFDSDAECEKFCQQHEYPSWHRQGFSIPAGPGKIGWDVVWGLAEKLTGKRFQAWERNIKTWDRFRDHLRFMSSDYVTSERKNKATIRLLTEYFG